MLDQLEGTLRMTNWSNCCAMPKQRTSRDGRLRDVEYLDTKGGTNNLNELVEQSKILKTRSSESVFMLGFKVLDFTNIKEDHRK